MPVKFIRNDITRVKADVIVNSANPNPTYGAGMDSAIYLAAGKEKLLEARKKIGEIKPGDVEYTPAFNLSAKYIFHAVGPVWEGGNSNEFDTLKNCYEKALNLAVELKCKSIAFPLISTGVYGFPKDKALQIAMNTIQSFLMENTLDVLVVVFDKASFELTGKVVDKVREYVDSSLVEELHRREFDDEYALAMRNFRIQSARNVIEEIPEVEEKKTISSPTKVNLSNLIDSREKTFQQKLFEIIDERKLTGPQVYGNYITKQVFSKIQSDINYHPNKYTAIALCLSLHLNIDDTLDLIGRAGWTLSPSNKADLVVRGCIINKVYKLMDINALLFDYNCDDIEKIK